MAQKVKANTFLNLAKKKERKSIFKSNNFCKTIAGSNKQTKKGSAWFDQSAEK